MPKANMDEVPDFFDPVQSMSDDFDPSAGSEIGLMMTEEPSTRTMPHPLTGKMTKFPRASKWGGILADDYVLREWGIGLAVAGVAKDEGLYALAHSTPLPDTPVHNRPRGWWMEFAKIGHLGMDMIGANTPAHLGTAFHQWAEQVDAGRLDPDDLPAKWQDHIQAYVRAHEALGMGVRLEYMERVVLCLELHNGVCGRLDGLREFRRGLIVDDTKTGRQAPKGADEIAVQLAVYAHAEWMWEPENPDAAEHYGWVPMPEGINQDIATITHVPIHDAKGTEVIPIDIRRGWNAARVAAWVREYRNAGSRDRNGLRLPLAALTSIGEPDTRLTTEEAVQRLTAAQTPEEISIIILDATNADVCTPALIRYGNGVLAKIKNGEFRM
jgi:hypothetical protein